VLIFVLPYLILSCPSIIIEGCLKRDAILKGELDSFVDMSRLVFTFHIGKKNQISLHIFCFLNKI